MRDDLEEILLTDQQIQQRLDVLGAELCRDYNGQDLTLVAVMTGSVMFVADLLRRITLPVRLDWVGAASYHGQTSSTGELVWTKELRLDVRGRDVLVIDDILDTGLTLAKTRDMLRRLEPRSLKFAVFLEKEVPHREDFRPDYVAFRIPDKFVVGYGLDYQERYRNLSCVGSLKQSVLKEKL